MTEKTTFHLLHLSLLREYFDHEFQKLKKFDDIYSDFKWLEGKAVKKANGKTVMDVTPGHSNVHQLLERKEEPGVIQPVKGRKVSMDLKKLMDSMAVVRGLRGELLFGRM